MKRLIYALLLSLVYSHAFGANWYFDKNSIGGACSDANAGSSITAPMCSPYYKFINNWNAPAAGDTIYLRAGNYTGQQFRFKAGTLLNGTEANPIVIRPYPNETVTFTAATDEDLLINAEIGYRHGIHFIGPFSASGYSQILDGGSPTVNNTGWRFENWNISNGSTGLYLRNFSNAVVKNVACSDLRGGPVNIADHSMCIGVAGRVDLESSNVTIEDVTAHDIHDGKYGDDGDADGVWSNQYVINLTLKNITAYRCEEDGVDVKAQYVTASNLVVYDNGASGFKIWGGLRARTGGTHFAISNVLSYSNFETGIKCSGIYDEVTAVIDHATVWGNGEDGIKNTDGIDVAGVDGSNGCNLTIRNSMIGSTGQTAVNAQSADIGYSVTTNFINTNIAPHTGDYNALLMIGCTPLSAKYSTAEYVSGAYNSDLDEGVACGGTYGTMFGLASNPSSFDPSLSSPTPFFEWAHFAVASVTSNVVTLATETPYPWPSPVVGHYVEIGDDGIRRQITGVGDATTRTITFTPAVTAPIYGRLKDGKGARVIGWDSNTQPTDDYTLQTISTAIDAGLFVAGVHCALADDNGGSGSTGCVHWSGLSPDLGYMEYGGAVIPPVIGNRWRIRAVVQP